MQSATDCIVCDAGYYCDGFGLVLPRGLCAAGYYCVSGSNTSTPSYNGNLNGTLYGGVCPRGSYCPAGSTLPTVSQQYINRFFCLYCSIYDDI